MSAETPRPQADVRECARVVWLRDGLMLPRCDVHEPHPCPATEDAVEPDYDLLTCRDCGGPWDQWHRANEGRPSWWAHRRYDDDTEDQ